MHGCGLARGPDSRDVTERYQDHRWKIEDPSLLRRLRQRFWIWKPVSYLAIRSDIRTNQRRPRRPKAILEQQAAGDHHCRQFRHRRVGIRV